MPLPIPRPDKAKHPHYGQLHHTMTAGSAPAPEFPKAGDVSDMGMTDEHNNNPEKKHSMPMPVAEGGRKPGAEPDAGEDESTEGAWETESMPNAGDGFESKKELQL